MQGYSPVKQHGAAAIFSSFCIDMEILPSYTPIFLIDGKGRIVYKKKLITSKEDFESVYNLVNDGEVPFMLEKGRMCDAYAVRSELGAGKSFIVVSKDRNGFSRCVVCSYSEEKCTKLDDYIQKLCSYKDYLDSFENLAFSSMARLPVKRIFKMKLSGALELLSLASDMQQSGDEKRLSFPLMLALEKLSAFAAKTNGGHAELIGDGFERSAVVNAPESFFRLAVSAMALVSRHSKSGNVSIRITAGQDKNSIRIVFSSKGTGKAGDIYERELISALSAKGFVCGVVNEGERYLLYIDVKTEERAELILSDVETISLRIDSIMSQGIVEDMYFTISDI